MLEFKYAQNKKQVVKRRVKEHTGCFHFTQIIDKNLQFPFKN